VANTVVTELPLLVGRDVEVVGGAVWALDAVELGAAVFAILDEDEACLVCGQYALKLGKHDDSGYTTPSCMMACMGESAAVKASVADV
jgi:hypothetical protein